MPRDSRFPKLEISPMFLFSIAVHLYYGLSFWLRNLLLAAFAHECGHALALWYFGVQIRSVRLTSLGAVMRIGPCSYREERIFAAAGPVTSALLAAACVRPYPVFALSSFGLALFNLLPLYPLDGGRILRAALRQRLNPVRAERIECRIAVGVSAAIMLASLLISRYGTHDLYPPMLAASILLRPVAADRKEHAANRLELTASDGALRGRAGIANRT